MLRLKVRQGLLPAQVLIHDLAPVPEQRPNLLEHLRMIRVAYRCDFPRHIIFDIRPVIPMESGCFEIPLLDFL